MKQLLNIQTTSAKLGFRVSSAGLELKSQAPSYEMTRDTRGLSMQSKNTRVLIDTFEARASVGYNVFRETRISAQKGIQKSNEATARYAEEGRMMLDVHKNKNAISDISKMRMNTMKEFGLGFSPSSPVKLTWEKPELNIDFEADKLMFDWRVNQSNLEYTPGNIEFYIEQYHSIEIEYLGGPLYVPPSSDPNYTPIDITA